MPLATDKLVPYVAPAYPAIEGQEGRFLATELRKIAQAIKSVEQIMATVDGTGSTALQALNNLSDVANAATARTNLGLGTVATHAASEYLTAANNLSDVANVATARTNLGVLAAAAVLQVANNLSDLANVTTARTNLGISTVGHTGAYSDLSGLPTLGTAAALNVGTASGNIPQLGTGGKLPAVDGSLLTNLPSSSPTSSTLPVGATALLMVNNQFLSVANGSTTTGSNLNQVTFDNATGTPAITLAAATQTGTWKNISGNTLAGASTASTGQAGLFVRTV